MKSFMKIWNSIIPEVGGTMYIDSMVVLKDSKNKENAEKFINYIYRPDVYVKNNRLSRSPFYK